MSNGDCVSRSSGGSQDFTVFLERTEYWMNGIKDGNFNCQTSISSEIDEETEDAEVTVYLSPTGYDAADSKEITIFLMPDGKNEIECLLCNPISSGPRRKSWEGETNRYELTHALQDAMNWARITHPHECPTDQCNYLDIDHNLMTSSETFAKTIDSIFPFRYNPSLSVGLARTADGLNTVERLQQYFSHYDYTGVYGECIAIFTYSRDLTLPHGVDAIPTFSAERLTTQCINNWQHHQKSFFNWTFDRMGASIKSSTYIEASKMYRREIVVCHFAGFFGRETTEEDLIPTIDIQCLLDCQGKIEWFQQYDERVTFDLEQGTEVTIKDPLKRVSFPLKQIPFICGMKRILFMREEGGIRGIYIPGFGIHHPVPEDGSLITNDEENLTFEEDLDAYDLVPGEWCAYVVELNIPRPYAPWSECPYVCIASGWFETKCLSSGFILGCGLVASQQDGDEVDGGGNPVMIDVVIDGGEGIVLQTEWIGDSRLHWLISFKGASYWLRPSDYTNYAIGQRVFIYKNGLSKLEGENGALTIEVGCRTHSVQENPETETHLEPLSSGDVAYRLDRSSDVIIPEQLADLIGIE